MKSTEMFDDYLVRLNGTSFFMNEDFTAAVPDDAIAFRGTKKDAKTNIHQYANAYGIPQGEFEIVRKVTRYEVAYDSPFATGGVISGPHINWGHTTLRKLGDKDE